MDRIHYEYYVVGVVIVIVAVAAAAADTTAVALKWCSLSSRLVSSHPEQKSRRNK